MPRGTDDGSGSNDVLVIETLGRAPAPRRRVGRRPGASSGQPERIVMSRATVIFSSHPAFEGEQAARTWVKRNASDEEARTTLLAAASRILNRAIHAAAVAGGDPYATDRHPAQAVAIRIGHGQGEELAEGNHSEARDVPAESKRRRRRSEGSVGQERVAAIVRGAEGTAPAETFILRARVDLDAGRHREAAIGLAAVSRLLGTGSELDLAEAGHAEDLSLVEAASGEITAIADRSAHSEPAETEVERVRDILAVCERILRRHRIRRG